ncbi:MAG: 30S ribosomal protein S19e [Halobacteria archaeon]|nr:30S ribosomal protein S19e [Halobacteria archaeon]
MTTAHDVPAEDLIGRLEDELRDTEGVEPPEWAEFAKTGKDRELPPEKEEWWYERAAAVLRKVYTKGPIGVSKLKKEYGGRDRGGMTPSHQKDGSGNVIRTALQQLEEENLVEQKADEGRVVTGEGRKLLDDVAGEIADEVPGLEKY